MELAHDLINENDKERNNNYTILRDDPECNSCVCVNGKSKCSNIWCGLANCLRTNSTSICQPHEVCVPALQESCLTPPCPPRGDCRALEPSRRVAPPKLPAKINCWPNQAELSEQCARITILLERNRITSGTSVEEVCLNLRILLGIRLVKTSQAFYFPLLIILCDIKSGSNDTIEVTVVSLIYGLRFKNGTINIFFLKYFSSHHQPVDHKLLPMQYIC